MCEVPKRALLPAHRFRKPDVPGFCPSNGLVDTVLTEDMLVESILVEGDGLVSSFATSAGLTLVVVCTSGNSSDSTTSVCMAHSPSTDRCCYAHGPPFPILPVRTILEFQRVRFLGSSCISHK
jgi:hypothetical protein